MDLLKKLLLINSPSGTEGDISNFILEETKKFGLETKTDALGNIILHKSGSGEKIMLAAHMDEIGIMVTYIGDNGFVRFAAIGGVAISELMARRVIFKNGTVGVIGTEEGKPEKPSINKMFIDIGASTKEETEALVSIGDTASFYGEPVISKDTVISKALDNRIGCYVLLRTIEKTLSSPRDIYYVFTTQEELGLRGAKTSAFGINPDVAVSIDTTVAGDTPGAKGMSVKMGTGVAIKVMDRSVITHPIIRSELTTTARDNNIPYQLEVLTTGGTDAGAIQLSAAGVKTAGISIPTRYIHSPSEMVSIKDTENAIMLLEKYLS